MASVNILTLQRLSAADTARILDVDPTIRLVDAGGWFDGEYRDTWPAFTMERYLGPKEQGLGTRAERDALLADADVIIGSFPFPLDLRARATRLKWFHQRPAGASNLLRGDLWGSDVVVTTSRGQANRLAIAEYAVAGIMHFAKGLHRVALERESRTFDSRAYRPWLLEGKTACVVGAGGIGLEVGRLLAALGLRVVGTRRSAPSGTLPLGFAEMGTADALEGYLRDADVVAVCCQLTPETENLFNAERFGLMKPGAIIANIARGEIIDEEALIAVLAADRLRGVVLDVYVGEFDRPPDERLWSDPRVMITPHISASSDQDRHGGMTLFCENLQAWLEGAPMQNVIDWARGY
jgi:glyoxylate/hydroxypyruvate reductase